MPALTKDTKQHIAARLGGNAMNALDRAISEIVRANHIIDEAVNLIKRSMEKENGNG